MKKLVKKNIRNRQVVLFNEYMPGTMFGLCD